VSGTPCFNARRHLQEKEGKKKSTLHM